MKPSLLLILTSMLAMASCNNATDPGSPATAPVVYTNDSLRIDYRMTGTGDTTLLFLHGWGIHKGYWDNQVNFFKDNYSVVTPDLVGFGQSDTGRINYSIEQYAKDVTDLVKKLNLRHVVLIGHSMSGHIILETAVNFPQNIIGVVGVDNFNEAGYTMTSKEEVEVKNFFDALRADYDSVATAYSAANLFQPSTDSLIRNRVINDIRSSNQTAAISSLENLMSFLPKEKPLLQALNLPLYLLNSDAVPTNEAALKALCKSSYRVFSVGHTGHYPMMEAAEVFNRRLGEVIRLIGGGK